MADPRICPHCGAPMPAGSHVCSVCGKALSEEDGALYLKSGVILAEKYRVIAVSSVQTDSVCYQAQNLSTLEMVTVREFLPRALIHRADKTDVTILRGSETLYQTALDDFVRLWRTVRSLHELPALPQVTEVFFSAGTAYAIETPLDCITLEEYLQTPGKLLTWESACRIFRPVILALGRLHACGVLHGALSPQTLFVASDGKLHIGGFSVSQTKQDIPELHSVPTAGFAPMELYDNRHAVGAYTDVYALAVVMYYAVTGICLPPATQRASGDDFLFTAQTVDLLTNEGVQTLAQALQIYPQRRTRTMEQFLQRMENRTAETSLHQTTVEEPGQPVQPPEDEGDSTSTGLLALKVFGAAALVIVLLFCTLYATVLYDKMEIPLLDKAFSAFSFLPMNREDDTAAEQTTAAPIVTQRAAQEMVTVPDFMSLTYGNIAGNTTFRRNFTLNFEFEENDAVRKNSIIRQSVPAGKTVEKGTAITITVSSGKPMIVLDDVLGMQYVDAYELLTEKGFVISKELTRNDGTHTVGEVWQMSQVAGLSFEKGTAVTLSVWDGSGLAQE